MRIPDNWRRKFAEELQNLSIGGSILLGILTLGSLFAAVHPYFDQLAHFRAIYLGFAIPALLVLAVRRHRMVVVPVVLVALNGWLAHSYLWNPLAEATGDCEPNITVLAINARGPASDHDALLELIERADPDVLFVSELRTGLKERIAERFPHVVWRPEPYTNYGLFTKYPVRGGTYILGPNGRPTINGVFETPRGPLRILGAHPSPPGSVESIHNRNAMLLQMAAAIRASAEPVLLLGDLNVTMFSPHYAPLEEAGLVNGRKHRGSMGTWPNWSPIRIPIDHVMVSPGLEICSLEIGDDFGSDHLPVHATVEYR